jgi:predicted nucleic acid-binding protein
MKRMILLDTGPLGKITHLRRFPEFTRWLKRLTDAGEDVFIPEISDYELRRGLLRRNDLVRIQRLDDLHTLLRYVPLTTAAMRKAAEFWADARRRGYATAPDLALDGDVILAAQAATLGGNTVIATENVDHLSRYTAAFPWDQIT